MFERLVSKEIRVKKWVTIAAIATIVAAVLGHYKVLQAANTSVRRVYADIYEGGPNVLQNPSFEWHTFSGGWTHTLNSGTDSTSAEPTIIHDGAFSFKETLNTAGTASISQDVTPTAKLYGTPLEASCYINTTLTDVQVCARVAGSTVVCSNALSDGHYHQVSVPLFSAGDGQTVGIEIHNQTAETGSWYEDDCYVGPSRNPATIQQAQDWGSLKLTGTAAGTNGCVFNETSSSNTATYNTLGSGASCNAWTATGNLTAPSTNSFTIPLGNTSAGTYRIHIHGSATLVGATGDECFGQLLDPDGATATLGQYMSVGTTITPEMDGSFTWTTAKSRTLTIQFSGTSTNVCGWYANHAGQNLQVDVDYYPPASQIVTQNSGPQSWSGYSSVTGGTGTWSTTSTSFVDPGVSGTPSITERVNNNFPAVTQAASSLPGITFTPNQVGTYWVCAKAHAGTTTSGDAVNLQLVDNSGTVISQANRFAENTTGYGQQVPLCGIYNVKSTSSAITLKIQMAMAAAGTATMASGTTTPVIEWSIANLSSVINAQIGIPSYWFGHHTGAASWSTTSSTLTDPTVSGTAALVTENSNNISCSTAASNLPGITCTFAQPGNYSITANTSMEEGAAGNIAQGALTDGSNTLIQQVATETYSNVFTDVFFTGNYAVTTPGTYTFKLRMSSSSGTATLSHQGINWSVVANVTGTQNGSVPPRSSVRLNTCSGWGSGNTAIRHFSNVDENTGTSITYAGSSVNGDSFTINQTGLYSMSFSDNAVGDIFGFSKNSSQLTTDIQSITAANALIYADITASGATANVSWTGILNAGDVIRPHDRTGQTDSIPGRCRFVITQVSN